jgi:uncharacterized membrane protein
VDGRVLWANLFLLFWLSLVPFVVRWIDVSHAPPLPTAAYGVVLGMASIGYLGVERALIACNGPGSTLAMAVGDDRKALISTLGYAAATLLAFVDRWLAIGLYIAIALMWFVPDRRIESGLKA